MLIISDVAFIPFPRRERWLWCYINTFNHDDVIKWKHFLRYRPFVRGIHRLPVNSPQKGQWRGVLMFSLICGWINARVNPREAGDVRRHGAHYDVNLMIFVHRYEGWKHVYYLLDWIKTVFPGITIPIMRIRRSSNRLIFIVGISILLTRHLFIFIDRDYR